ncbi:MAG TPA: hypothetical protein DIW86_03935 [Pseudomonas sp.]|nr:hypothetical protein [Pseudomonas sp.]
MGAGLPAMEAPRCIRYTAVMLSQASQLPHRPAPTGTGADRYCVLRTDVAGLHHGVELLRIATLLTRTIG